MIELFFIIPIVGIIQSIYKLGQIPRTAQPLSWEFIGLSLTWGALWPVMLLLRFSESAFKSFRGGLKDGQRAAKQSDAHRLDINSALDEELERWRYDDEIRIADDSDEA